MSRAACRFECDFLFFLKAEDGIRDVAVTGVQTCALPIAVPPAERQHLPGGIDDNQASRCDAAMRPHEGDHPMGKPFRGVVNIDIKDSVPDWAPYTQPMAPEGAPNVLYVVLDDVGFSAMSPYGGLIETPNIQRIADRGVTYTNFHTTAPCSP